MGLSLAVRGLMWRGVVAREPARSFNGVAETIRAAENEFEAIARDVSAVMSVAPSGTKPLRLREIA
jgi:hypothetical protein